MEGSIAHKVIAESSGKISALAALPIPLIDVAAMTYFQYEMVRELADQHRIEIKDSTNLIISSIISTLISKLITAGIEKLTVKTKLDSVLQASLIRASISGFLITLIGEVYNFHFEKGGNLDNINLRTFVAYFEKQFRSDRWTFASLTDEFMSVIDNQFQTSL